MLETRKDKMLEIVFNGDYNSNDAIIYKFLLSSTLDELIGRLNDKKTKCIKSTICNYTGKGFLTSEEQFLDLLNNFIVRFKTDFYFLGSYEMLILQLILENGKNDDFLLCKNYWGNNDFIKYFKYNIEKYIVTAFYDNLKSVAEVSDKVKYFLKEKGIKINKISLRHHDDVSKLYKLLRELSVSNHDTWSSLFLFSSLQKQILEMKDEIDIMDRSIRLLENYALQYEIAIKNYYSKKDAISILL